MVSRSNHYNARYRFDLSPRQREVLDLIAAGRTNAEIAELLGITLDGAKWHVREILAKLEVESREEAVAAWRDHNRPAARIWRALSGIALPVAVRWIVVSAVAGTAIAGGAALYMALQSDDPDPGHAQPAATALAAADAALPACDGSRIVLGLRVEPWLGGTLITVDITNNGPACLVPAGLAVRLAAPPGVPQPGTTSVFFPPASLPSRGTFSTGGQPPVRLAWLNECNVTSMFAISADLAGISLTTATGVPPPPCTDPSTGASLFPAEKLDGIPACDRSQLTVAVTARSATGSVVIAVEITNGGGDCMLGALVVSVPDRATGAGVAHERNFVEFSFVDGQLRAGKRGQWRYAWTNGCALQGPPPFVISATIAGAKAATLTTASAPCDRPSDPPSLRRLPLQSASASPPD